MRKVNNAIRNIAIIAHVDHGKTTLVDSLFALDGIGGEDRIMDSGNIERERGITLTAKNCSINYKNVKINILDTPGHSDFGGEVERALSMVDGAILLVDAAEGPLPQTRFVLSKALEQNIKPIILINKIDRQDQRAEEVLNEVYDLLLDLSDDESLLELPVFYAIGKDGVCKKKLDGENLGFSVLLDSVLSYIKPPEFDDEKPFQMLVSDIGYSEFVGRLAIGKVINGSVTTNDSLVCIAKDEVISLRVTRLQTYQGPSMVETSSVNAGDIVVIAGLPVVTIGDTICEKNNIEALPRITVDKPTVSMEFRTNITPLSGTEGTKVTSSAIYERLQKELLNNVSISVERSNQDTFIVKGRGEFQLAILVEAMRREGFELCLGRARAVILEDENGSLVEPINNVLIDCPSIYSGAVMEKLSARNGIVLSMEYPNDERVIIEYKIPVKSLIGYRDDLLTDTKGTAIMYTTFCGYEKLKPNNSEKNNGSLVADRAGNAVPYAISELEDRGEMFIVPGDPLYEGQVVGRRNREGDLMINPTKTKKLTNLRASGKDEAVTITAIIKPTLEKAMRLIKDDEYVEVTPLNIRMCKRILNTQERKVYNNRKRKDDIELLSQQ